MTRIVLPDDDARQTLAQPTQPREGVLAASVAGERHAVRASSPYFVTDPGTWCAELHDPFVLVLGAPLATIEPLATLLLAVAEAGRPICVCAPAVQADALLLLIINKLRGIICAAAVDAEPAALAAIAAATGTDVQGAVPATLGSLGAARHIVVADRELALVRRAGH